MATALLTHEDCGLHQMGAEHPERPARLAAVLDALRAAGQWPRLTHVQAQLAAREDLTLAHPAEYIDYLFNQSPASGVMQLDGDTAMNEHSLRAALLAAGAGVQAVDMVLAGEVSNAFCCVRPPGHHAERATAMGFCFFSSIAVAALHALEQNGVDRVALVDFDVHHGNGSEDILRDDERVFFCSTFQYPLYPGKYGQSIDGRVINLPLSGGASGAEFKAVMERECLPALEKFNPDLILISAGFDAHADDLLGGLSFREQDFSWITAELLNIAAACCGGKVVSMLEGGYDLASLGNSASAHVEALLDAG